MNDGLNVRSHLIIQNPRIAHKRKVRLFKFVELEFLAILIKNLGRANRQVLTDVFRKKQHVLFIARVGMHIRRKKAVDKRIGRKIRHHVGLRDHRRRTPEQDDRHPQRLDLVEPVDPVANPARVDAVDLRHVDQKQTPLNLGQKVRQKIVLVENSLEFEIRKTVANLKRRYKFAFHIEQSLCDSPPGNSLISAHDAAEKRAGNSSTFHTPLQSKTVHPPSHERYRHVFRGKSPPARLCAQNSNPARIRRYPLCHSFLKFSPGYMHWTA